MITFLLSVFLILFLTGRAPLRNLISLIGIFGFASLLLIYYDVEFLGWMLIMIYIGAIGVLFLFLIMTTDFRNIESTPSVSSYDYLLYVLICLLLFLHLPNFTSEGSFLQDELLATVPSDNFWGLQKWYHLETNTLFFVGLLMFNKYYVFVHLAAWILLIALVAAVGLSSDRWNDIKNLAVPAFLMKRLDEYPSDLINFSRKNNIDPTILDEFRTVRYLLPDYGRYSARQKWNIDSPYALHAMKRFWKIQPRLGRKYRYYEPMNYDWKKTKVIEAGCNEWPFKIGHKHLKTPFIGKDNVEVGDTWWHGGKITAIERDYGSDLCFELFNKWWIDDEGYWDYMNWDSHWFAHSDWYFPDNKKSPFRYRNLKVMLKNKWSLTTRGEDIAAGGERLNVLPIRQHKCIEWDQYETPELFLWITYSYWMSFVFVIGWWIYTRLTNFLFRTDSPYLHDFGTYKDVIDPYSARGRFKSWKLVPKKLQTDEFYYCVLGTPMFIYMVYAIYALTTEPGWFVTGAIAWTWTYPVGRPQFRYNYGDDWFVLLQRLFNWLWKEYDMDSTFIVRWYNSPDPVEFFYTAVFTTSGRLMDSGYSYVLTYNNPMLAYLYIFVILSLAFCFVALMSFIWFPLFILTIWADIFMFLVIQPYLKAYSVVVNLLLDIDELAEYHLFKNRGRPDFAKFESDLIDQAGHEFLKTKAFIVRPFYLDPYEFWFVSSVPSIKDRFKKLSEDNEKVYANYKGEPWMSWEGLRYYPYDPAKYEEYNLALIQAFGPSHTDWWEQSYWDIYNDFQEVCEENEEKNIWSWFKD